MCAPVLLALRDFCIIGLLQAAGQEKGSPQWGNASYPSASAAIPHAVSVDAPVAPTAGSGSNQQEWQAASNGSLQKLPSNRSLQALPSITSECRPPMPMQLVSRKPEEALQLLRTALGRRGAHGGLEFAQQLRAASTRTSAGEVVGFTDLARVVARFCTMPDAYLHAIFRVLDKDCYGCVRVSDVIDTAFTRLSIPQINQVKIAFAVCLPATMCGLTLHDVEAWTAQQAQCSAHRLKSNWS